MRAIVVGLGVQGHKRRQFAGQDYIACVDPIHPEANYREIAQVPLDQYDAALLCVPDEPKVALIRYLLENNKHVLVEKPLFAEQDDDLIQLSTLARSRKLVCYTAYNHHFEPHFVRMRSLIQSGELGKIYHCRMFYGNGTARLVRDSAWRDQGAGVLPDLGSHLLDTLAEWFGVMAQEFSIVSSHCFENHAPDHVVFTSQQMKPKIELEMTLLSWRNHFTCDIFAELGSAHISSLCKWGPSEFVHRKRVLPSGRPIEESHTLIQSDPTWALEYEYFKNLCQQAQNGDYVTDLSRDLWIGRILKYLGQEAIEIANATKAHKLQPA